MTEQLRNVYAHKAISQIPRILGNMDRNPYSPTYGCFHRDYWLDKTSDFPDAVRQFGVHALALVYKHDFPGNIYKNKQKVKNWAIAALKFWSKIQHKDGSFDEFYPYERGWVGPTAFTMFTVVEAYNILEPEMERGDKDTMLAAIKKAAYFIAKGESEEDHLANHHAMACLALWKAYELLKEEPLKDGFEKAFQTFLTYHNADEGWSREYDGVDPGYLSATVSFFAKIYQTNKDERILKVIKESVEFSGYFVYPNGFYAGSLGSRNTLHFYCHGYEVVGNEIPMANAIAQKLLKGLSENKLVSPEIISDRYLFYRIPEFLQAYLDYTEPKDDLPQLPYERAGYTKFHQRSRIFASVKDPYYIAANLAKGGVVKIFNRNENSLLVNDCGIMGRLSDGTNVTTQWVNLDYEVENHEKGWTVKGKFNKVPSNKLFTPLKQIIFRSVLVAVGWIPAMAHFIKGQIRKALILGQREIPIAFERHFSIEGNTAQIDDYIQTEKNVTFESLSIGDEFFVRYVPQSRYFQSQELQIEGFELNTDQLKALNSNKKIKISQTIQLDKNKKNISTD
ncbi:hypothetical protein [Salinivirga cyanobacteriivorans]